MDIEIKDELAEIDSSFIKEEYDSGEEAVDTQNESEAMGDDSIKLENDEEMVQFEITEIEQSGDHECEICHELFESRREMMNHRRKHPGQKIMHCAYCPKKFSNKQILSVHVRNHVQVKCRICQQSFSTSLVLEKHMDKVHVFYKCKLCDTRIISKGRLNMHLHENHERKHKSGSYSMHYKCLKCKVEYNKKVDLKRHFQCHHNPGHSGPLNCLYCSMHFTTYTYLEIHVSKDHRGLPTGFVNFPVACTICKKNFESLQSLREHSSAHELNEVFCCGFCQKQISNADKLKQHVASMHKGKPLPENFPDVWTLLICRSTGKTYYKRLNNKTKKKAKKSNKKKITEDETETPYSTYPYKCPYCDRIFHTRERFNNHINTHEEPAQSSDIIRSKIHMMYGKDRTFYKCRLCNKNFFFKTEVMEHEKSHENYKDIDRVTDLYLLLKKAKSAKNIVRYNKSSKETPNSTIVKAEDTK